MLDSSVKHRDQCNTHLPTKRKSDLADIRTGYYSSSPWASPIYLVRKKSVKVRPFIDYRKVNSLGPGTDAYPLLRVRDCLDTVAGAKVFSTLDLTFGHHYIAVKKI